VLVLVLEARLVGVAQLVGVEVLQILLVMREAHLSKVALVAVAEDTPPLE
jgi:hypothetical protein